VLTGEANLLESPKTWIDAYLKLDDDDAAMICFKEFGERCISAELDSGELPVQLTAVKLCRNATSSKSLETDHGCIFWNLLLSFGTYCCLLEPIAVFWNLLCAVFII